MRVKIGNTWFDPNDQPIMIQLDESDKEFIKDMPKRYTKYCAYPEGTSEHEVDKFMEELKPLKLHKRRA